MPPSPPHSFSSSLSGFAPPLPPSLYSQTRTTSEYETLGYNTGTGEEERQEIKRFREGDNVDEYKRMLLAHFPQQKDASKLSTRMVLQQAQKAHMERYRNQGRQKKNAILVAQSNVEEHQQQQQIQSSASFASQRQELQDWMSLVWQNLQQLGQIVESMQTQNHQALSAKRRKKRTTAAARQQQYIPKWFLILICCFGGFLCLSVWSIFVILVTTTRKQ